MKKIFIQLLDEGTTTYRPTQGVDHGNNVFYVLPTAEYDSNTETWEFPPGSLVVCEQIQRADGDFLLATKIHQ